MRKDWLLVIFISLVAMAFVVVFCVLPRSTFSELEKRDLKSFPSFSWSQLASGCFNADVSEWFSDSEPYRDVFMACNMQLKSWMGLKIHSDENVTFHAPSKGEAKGVADNQNSASQVVDESIDDVIDVAEVNVKVADAGVIVVGTAPNARALMAFKNHKDGGSSYAKIVNKYQQTFGPEVNVYCMVIPTAVEFYCPEKAKSCTEAELPILSNFYTLLDDSVRNVDIYEEIGKHLKEDIYLRTDHHWAPLGAYYAARKFAQVAKVKVPDITDFERCTIDGFVGSMYGYSNDVTVKNSPETFVFYKLKNIEYSTTYTKYSLDEKFNIVSEEEPSKGEFFVNVSSSASAYCTFMGNDARITKVETNADSNRKLLLLKDSFGNAIPGFLFGSFKEVHVVDFRYFTYNIKDYVKQNGITDILMANNLSQVCTGAVSAAYRRFLTQTHQ